MPTTVTVSAGVLTISVDLADISEGGDDTIVSMTMAEFLASSMATILAKELN